MQKFNYTYYVRNVAGNTCEITGVVTDNTGLDEVNAVQLQIPGLPTKTCTDGHFDFTDVDFSSLSDGVTAKVVAMDSAGNTFEHSIEFIFDTTAPAGIHEIDAKDKDLYFRVGDGNNGDGSKYSNNS